MKIVLENIIKKFDDINAVNNLSLEIEDGELVSILGPSGCGKSTTLFLLAGLYTPDSGKIYFNNEDMTFADPEDRGIGMVFQNYALYPHMTVLENIEFPLKMKKVNKKIREKKAIDMAKLVKIEKLLDRKPSELSGGQQQRVAISRALVKKPSILLLDEPLSNLDARLRIEMREEIRRIQQEINITTIFVTHDQEEAMSISDRILLMKDGECQQYSNPKDMYLNPNNRFVAKFLGNPPINFIKGNYKKEKFHIYDSSKEIDLHKYKIKNLDKNKILGIRPEDLYIVSKEKSILCVEVSSIQIMGKEIYVMGDLDKNNKIMFITSWDYDINIGEIIYLDAKKVHLF